MNTLLSLLGRLTSKRIDKWSAVGSTGDFIDEGVEADIMDGANVVMSRRTDLGCGDYHAVLLDLDIPAYLVPSSTPGHSHLYIDTAIPQERYYELLRLLVECGIIEAGYASASMEKGGTYLRLPWVKKEIPEDETVPAVPSGFDL